MKQYLIHSIKNFQLPCSYSFYWTVLNSKQVMVHWSFRLWNLYFCIPLSAMISISSIFFPQIYLFFNMWCLEKHSFLWRYPPFVFTFVSSDLLFQQEGVGIQVLLCEAVMWGCGQVKTVLGPLLDWMKFLSSETFPHSLIYGLPRGV